MPLNDNYLAQILDWQAGRLATMQEADGWLSIIGRWPLDEDAYFIGSSPTNDIVLPVGPSLLGRLELDKDGTVKFVGSDGRNRMEVKQTGVQPERFAVDRFVIEITSVNGDRALRARDTLSRRPAQLATIPYFEVRPQWRILADWQSLDEPRTIQIDTIIGVKVSTTVTHTASFRLDGAEYELLSTFGTADRPQFIFRDSTSGRETYAKGRFLFGEQVTDNSIVLDFNKSINPPCAFTPYAACPLPPEENTLPFRVDAGERLVVPTKGV